MKFSRLQWALAAIVYSLAGVGFLILARLDYRPRGDWVDYAFNAWFGLGVIGAVVWFLQPHLDTPPLLGPGERLPAAWGPWGRRTSKIKGDQ